MNKSQLSSFFHRFKKTASILVIIATLVLFVYYATHHRQQLTSLNLVGSGTIVLLLFLYTLFLLTNAWILYWSVQICRKTIDLTETLLLTSYSTLVNFFGPLQSGPGFRAIYLKKKHDVSIKSYGISTLVYYASFGAISLLMLSYGFQPIIAAVAFVLILAGIIFGASYISRKHPELTDHTKQVSKVICFTAVQIGIVLTIYLLELRKVNSHISLSQAIVYTGAANLALFVSLTPGAIGFRESFLLFSQRLHHIDTNTILAASVIDRAIFFVVLLLLFIFTSIFHIRDRLTD